MDEMRHDYEIGGMNCGSCVAKVTEALEGVEGVASARVGLEPPRAEVTMRDHVPLSALRSAVAARGEYTLSPAKADERGAADEGGGVDEGGGESLYPLLLIVVYLLGGVLLIEWSADGWSWSRVMRHFMAGFFLVFSFFKLLDPAGFVSAYRGYDLLARRSRAWAWSYPYVELGLGAAYLLDVFPVVVNAVTLVLMVVGAAGVIRALRERRSIRCACLGTALNLPMTKVTLVEDLTMAVMAGAMLVMRLV